MRAIRLQDRLALQAALGPLVPLTGVGLVPGEEADLDQDLEGAPRGPSSRAALAGFGGSSGSSTSSTFSLAGPGGPGDPAKAFGRNFFTPPSTAPKVPTWFGKGGTAGMPDPGAGTGPYKPILDHIARSEGTANQAGGGYNTSLGYGRFLPGGQEQNLTGKSLNEILALGDHMRRQPATRTRPPSAAIRLSGGRSGA